MRSPHEPDPYRDWLLEEREPDERRHGSDPYRWSLYLFGGWLLVNVLAEVFG